MITVRSDEMCSVLEIEKSTPHLPPPISLISCAIELKLRTRLLYYSTQLCMWPTNLFHASASAIPRNTSQHAWAAQTDQNLVVVFSRTSFLDKTCADSEHLLPPHNLHHTANTFSVPLKNNQTCNSRKWAGSSLVRNVGLWTSTAQRRVAEGRILPTPVRYIPATGLESCWRACDQNNITFKTDESDAFSTNALWQAHQNWLKSGTRVVNTSLKAEEWYVKSDVMPENSMEATNGENSGK